MLAVSALLLYEASPISIGKVSVAIDSGIVVAVCFILFARTGSLTGEVGSLGPLPDEIPAGLEAEAAVGSGLLAHGAGLDAAAALGADLALAANILRHVAVERLAAHHDVGE